jgi:hypothetical protein
VKGHGEGDQDETGEPKVYQAERKSSAAAEHLVSADVVCGYLKPGSFEVFEFESVLGVPVSP